MRNLRCGVALLGLLWSIAACAQDQTFADLLRQHGIPFPPASIPHLNAHLWNNPYPIDTAEQFAVAYHLSGSNGNAQPGTFLTVYDKQTGVWKHAELKATEKFQDRIEVPCEGQLGEPQYALDHYFISAELSPSAACTFVLDQDLQIEAVLDGWPVGFLPPSSVLYEGSMVHFADVHPETLWLYDTRTKSKLQLYPQPHDLFREEFSSELEKVIQPKLCAKNNWACEPDRFSSDLTIPLTVNPATNSFAVHVTFTPEGYLPVDNDDGPYDDVTYIYQLSPFRWREFRTTNLKKQVGSDSLPDLLTPEALIKIFAASD